MAGRRKKLILDKMLQTGPQSCSYCGNKFSHYFALKCHVVKVHPREYKRFLQNGYENADSDSGNSGVVPVARNRQLREEFARERRKITRLKKIAGGTSLRRTALPTSTRCRKKEADAPKPIGTLILCDICEEEFYDPVYLQWHVKIEHAFIKDGGEGGRRIKNGKRLVKLDVHPKQTGRVAHRTVENFKKVHGLPHVTIERCATSNKIEIMSLKNQGIEKNQFVCKFCAKVFVDSARLKRHLSCHLTLKALRCPECRDFFYNENKLQEHISSTHGRVPQASSNEMTGKSRYGDNMVKDHTKLALRCYLCKKFYVDARGLCEHMRAAHRTVEIVKCEYCRERVRVDKLVGHVRNHEKPFQCKVCRKKFSFEKEKCIHERKHTSFYGMKYSCHKCKKNYFYKRSRDRHYASCH